MRLTRFDMQHICNVVQYPAGHAECIGIFYTITLFMYYLCIYTLNTQRVRSHLFLYITFPISTDLRSLSQSSQ